MSSTSTRKKRPKPYLHPTPTTTNNDTDNDNNNNTCSTSPSYLLKLLMGVEPSADLFPSPSEFLKLFATVAIAVSVAVSCNLFVGLFTRYPIPFCDSDSHLDLLPDFCEPCPRNGVCSEGKLDCVHGYRKHGNSCMEDGNMNEAAKKLGEWAETHVCKASAHLLCNGIGTIWVSEDEIWSDLNDVKSMERFGLDSATYMYAKQRAIETIGTSLDRRTNDGIREFKCPDFLVESYKPLICRTQQWISRNSLVVIPLCALFVGCILLHLRFHQRHQISIRAEQLYCQVCDVLEENALTTKSVNGHSEPWVVASWLRDDLLLPSERKNPLLWKQVEQLVQEDTRLDWYPKLIKGEPKVVWQWQVEGSVSSSNMRKKEGWSKLKSPAQMSMKAKAGGCYVERFVGEKNGWF